MIPRDTNTKEPFEMSTAGGPTQPAAQTASASAAPDAAKSSGYAVRVKGLDRKSTRLNFSH